MESKVVPLTSPSMWKRYGMLTAEARLEELGAFLCQRTPVKKQGNTNELAPCHLDNPAIDPGRSIIIWVFLQSCVSALLELIYKDTTARPWQCLAFVELQFSGLDCLYSQVLPSQFNFYCASSCRSIAHWPNLQGIPAVILLLSCQDSIPLPFLNVLFSLQSQISYWFHITLSFQDK